MDCDDNDLYSQNLRLADEGSNEFLPVLQPYALSKFDFGESLHGRFDSLVETEAFFGSEEHNQWIEEIHCGSSGIPYSSAVRQSCSIPRCGNVWSEATSLESVEMLLKSVGQEETISVQTDTKELDTCDELGCILKQMDRGAKQGDNAQSEKGGVSVTDSQPIMPHKELLDSSLIVDMDGQEQKHQMEDSLRPYEGGISVVESLNNSTTINVDAHICDSSERSLSVDGKFNEVSEEDVKTVIDNSFDLKTQDSALGTNKKSGADGDQNFHTDHIKLNDEIPQFRKDEASYSNADISETEKEAQKSLSSTDVTVDKQVLIPSMVESVASEVGNTLPSASAEPKGVASVIASSTVLEGGNVSGLSVHDSMLIVEHNVMSEKNEVENFGSFSSQKEVDGSDIGHADCSVTAVAAFPVMEINSETCNIDRIPSSSKDESSHVYAKNLVLEGGDGNKDEQDSINEKKESTKLPSDCVNMNCGVGVSSMTNKDDGFSQDKVIASESHSDVSGGKSGFTSPNEEKGTVATTSTEAGPSNLISSSQVTAGADRMFESGNEVSMDAKETISEPGDQHMSNKTPIAAQIALDNKACQDSTNETQTCPVLNVSNKNNGNETETPDKESSSVVSGVDAVKKGQAEDGLAIVSEDPSSKSSLGTTDPDKQVTTASAVNVDHSRSENDNNLIGGPSDRSVLTSRDTPPVCQDTVVIDTSKDDKHLTSEASAPLEFPGKKLRTPSRSSSTRKPKKASQVVDKLLSTSSASQLETKSSQDLSLESPKVTTTHSRSKSNTVRKPRRSSKTKGTDEKQTPVKEAGLDRRDKINMVTQTASDVHMQSNDFQRSTNTNPLVLSAPTSGLPDLNSSVSPSVVFQQPFTDLQQVQLRAQIFVYGALIQGTVPDEAYMISAFGGLDGDRAPWEKAWHLCAERFRGQKSLLTTNTSSHSRAGPAGHKASYQTVKQKKTQSKVTSSPGGQDGTKGSPVSLVNPVTPISSPPSPLWGIPAFSADTLQSSGMPRGLSMEYKRAYSPLRPHQTLPMHSVVGQSPWMSPFGSPWVTAAQTSSLDMIGRFPMQRPITEPVKLTPVKEMPLPQLAGTTQLPPASVGQSEPSTISTLLHVPEMNKVTPSSVPHSMDPKPRKRKKNSVPDSHGLNIVHSKSHTPVPAYGTSTSAITPLTSVVSKMTTEVLASATPPVSTDLKSGDQDGRKKAVLSYEKVKEAMQQSDAAAALASAAVLHSQEVWDQLGKQESGLLPDIETKLASAAVAVAAAAAVSKAAAAAANVASNAALQAKLMAEEAAMELGKGTPGSILKHNEETNKSNSSLVAAREATSAASKRAENINAIIKAAELVSEAVSQAGKIVAMGDTFPLRDLLAAGPENYWKIGQATPELVSNTNAASRQYSEVDAMQAPATSSGHLEEWPSKQKETNYGRIVDGVPVSSLANVNVVEDKEELEALDSSVTQTDLKKPLETSKENGITEGSHVEVFKDGNGFKAAWFLADILRIKDGEAYVIYSDLTGEGLEKLKEWVPLKGEGDEVPRVRVSRPPMPLEGTRKRRRAAAGNHIWSIGDRVDAWIQESWWEGIITEKNKKDDKMFTIHFPAQGETSVIQASHLRPSLMWKDGQWIEFTNPRKNTRSSYGGDTPQRKRSRLQSPKVEGKGKDLVVSGAGAEESDKPTEPTLLDLSASEKIFDIGKSTVDGSKQGNRHQTTQTGPLKEGSRVKFGVPKPGKKRKFMEVSKHYVAGHSENVDNVNEGNDLIKSAKFSTPQGLGLQAWKSARKTEPVEKGVAASKPKVPKPGKPPSISSRTISHKGNSTANSASEHNETNSDTKKVTSDAIPEGELKGKPATAARKLQKTEDKVMDTISGDVEPRRSNRRIQPTSRLLEGLQSSLMVSKITSAASHEKRDHIRTPSAHPKGMTG